MSSLCIRSTFIRLMKNPSVRLHSSGVEYGKATAMPKDKLKRTKEEEYFHRKQQQQLTRLKVKEKSKQKAPEKPKDVQQVTETKFKNAVKDPQVHQKSNDQVGEYEDALMDLMNQKLIKGGVL